MYVYIYVCMYVCMYVVCINAFSDRSASPRHRQPLQITLYNFFIIYSKYIFTEPMLVGFVPSQHVYSLPPLPVSNKVLIISEVLATNSTTYNLQLQLQQ
jgi:hypothetical protein